MAKILLGLAPIVEARWETYPGVSGSGIRFLIAPLTGEEDHDLQRECSDLMGVLDHKLFAQKFALAKLKSWEGIGDAKSGQETACNEVSIKAFVAMHLQSILPWMIRRARSLDHYMQQEVEAAKKD